VLIPHLSPVEQIRKRNVQTGGKRFPWTIGVKLNSQSEGKRNATLTVRRAAFRATRLRYNFPEIALFL
jgi:hypothetical protein